MAMRAATAKLHLRALSARHLRSKTMESEPLSDEEIAILRQIVRREEAQRGRVAQAKAAKLTKDLCSTYGFRGIAKDHKG